MTDCKNFIFVEELIEGQQHVIDRRNQHVIPIVQAHCDGDCCSANYGFCVNEANSIVWRGEKPPGPGARVCWLCGHEWILEEGAEDVCPSCGRPNVIREAESLDQMNYVSQEQNAHAKEVLAKNRELLKKFMPKTIGDLSWEHRHKNNAESRRQRLRAAEQGLTVGDLSVASELKRKRNAKWSRKKANSAGGLTVGDLSWENRTREA